MKQKSKIGSMCMNKMGTEIYCAMDDGFIKVFDISNINHEKQSYKAHD